MQLAAEENRNLYRCVCQQEFDDVDDAVDHVTTIHIGEINDPTDLHSVEDLVIRNIEVI